VFSCATSTCTSIDSEPLHQEAPPQPQLQAVAEAAAQSLSEDEDISLLKHLWQLNGPLVTMTWTSQKKKQKFIKSCERGGNSKSTSRHKQNLKNNACIQSLYGGAAMTPLVKVLTMRFDSTVQDFALYNIVRR
jgi:hypothetical protein